MIQKFLKTSKTYSQPNKLISWNVENTQLPESIYVNCSPTHPNIYQSFNIKFIYHTTMNIW